MGGPVEGGYLSVHGRGRLARVTELDLPLDRGPGARVSGACGCPGIEENVVGRMAMLVLGYVRRATTGRA